MSFSFRNLVGGTKPQPEQPAPRPPAQRPAAQARPAPSAPRPAATAPAPAAPQAPSTVAATRAAAADGGATATAPVSNELRSAPRRPAAAVPEITGLRLSPHGAEATLINISGTGLLVECGERLQPGSKITVQFEGPFKPSSVEGRVARNSVSSMANGRLRYHVGIAFNAPIELEDLPAPPVVEVPAEPPAAEPALVAAPVETAASAVSSEPVQAAEPVAAAVVEAVVVPAAIVEAQATPSAAVYENRW